MTDPLELFTKFYNEELKGRTVRIPSACCLSTIGQDGYPNARFLSLKEIKDGSFIITGPLSSRKGFEIQKSSKVAVTFWWTETEVQIRIQGDAEQISVQDAREYFIQRQRDSQIISLVSDQGQYLEDLEILNTKYEAAEVRYRGKEIPKPDYWSGYAIRPVRMEFMKFKKSRFHERTLYLNYNGHWEMKLLQP